MIFSPRGAKPSCAIPRFKLWRQVSNLRILPGKLETCRPNCLVPTFAIVGASPLILDHGTGNGEAEDALASQGFRGHLQTEVIRARGRLKYQHAILINDRETG